MKHAFLILAHNEFDILFRLIACLDDERNDIYIHFDKKTRYTPIINTQKASLFVLKDRVDVRWGDFSMVKAEFLLFEKALENGPYLYYHLLSGVDLPLKSQNYIHDFFDKNRGKEFIGYMNDWTPSMLEERFQYWYLFPKDFRKYWGAKRVLRISFIRIQQLLRIKRKISLPLKKGSQWVSITEGMVKLFLSNKAWITKTYRNTFCSDESVFQTICWSSPYRNNLYNSSDDGIGCMRLIGWRTNGQLEDWCRDDYELLGNAPHLFARKFNYSDIDFIQDVLALSNKAKD